MPNETKATVASLQSNKALSGALLKAFYDGSDAKKVAEKVAQAEGSRMSYLFSMFPNTAVEQIKAAVKEYKDMAAKEHGEKSPGHKSAGVRGSEIQSLYGAWRWADFRPDGMGYKHAVDESRQMLKALNVRWTGERIPEKWERDVRKQVQRESDVELATRMEIEKRHRAGEEVTEEQAEAIKAEQAEQQQRADMVTLAGALFRKYGGEKCGWLIDALEGVIASGEQQERDAATAKRQAVAGS